MVLRVSPLAVTGLPRVLNAQPAQTIQQLRFGSDSAPADDKPADPAPKGWWSRLGKPFLRAVFMYDLPSKPAIDELVKAYPASKEAKTLRKHAGWAENTLRVLNWANWAMIFTLPIPFVHFVTGPVLLGTAVLEIGARIGLESYMHKRTTKLYEELSKPSKA